MNKYKIVSVVYKSRIYEVKCNKSDEALLAFKAGDGDLIRTVTSYAEPVVVDDKYIDRFIDDYIDEQKSGQK